MSYYGGKEKQASAIARHIQPLVDVMPGGYYEPFLGLGSVCQRVVSDRRHGSDSHASVINMLTAIRDGWEPPSEISSELYSRLSRQRDVTSPLDSYVGHMCSYAGRYWGGYVPSRSFDGYTYRAAEQAARKVKRMRPKLQGVSLSVGDFRSLRPQGFSVVYLDPPYLGTDAPGSGGTADFMEEDLLRMVRTWTNDGHVIFLSYHRDLGLGDKIWEFRCNTRGFNARGIDGLWRIE